MLGVSKYEVSLMASGRATIATHHGRNNKVAAGPRPELRHSQDSRYSSGQTPDTRPWSSLVWLTVMVMAFGDGFADLTISRTQNVGSVKIKFKCQVQETLVERF